jgi:hypothetical protein
MGCSVGWHHRWVILSVVYQLTRCLLSAQDRPAWDLGLRSAVPAGLVTCPLTEPQVSTAQTDGRGNIG